MSGPLDGVPVTIKDNIQVRGWTNFKGSAVTRGPSGSFDIERKIADKPGADSITATARNTDGGERCAAQVSI